MLIQLSPRASRAHGVTPEMARLKHAVPDDLGAEVTDDVGAHAFADDVVLVDRRGQPIGHCPKRRVHQTTTPLHLAFSLYLFDTRARVLLTRRALTKTTWPGVWTNSCCGHPRVGESVVAAVQRRLHEELGVAVMRLACVLPEFTYSAIDPGGIQENEYCPVFCGQLPETAKIRANTAEVMDHAWLDWDELARAAAAAPFLLSPWASKQIPMLRVRNDHPIPVRSALR